MPYTSVNELPEHVKKYSDKVKRQWMYVFNSTFKKTDSEARAFQAANSVLKKRLTKDKNSQDYINHLVDRWLGNLDG